jgi:cobalt-zinc-cadmium efflux system membrane fusion protein
MKPSIITLMLILGTAGLAEGQEGRGPGPRFRGGKGDQPLSPLAKQVVSLPASAIDAAGIKMEKIERRDCPCILKAVGKVLAPQTRTAIVSHFLPGRVAEIHVKLGEWIKKGQPLVTLECSEVAAAMSEFFKAVAAHELAQLNLAREKRLAEGGIGAKKDHLAAAADFKVAQANLEAAEKRLHVLGFTEEQVKEIGQTHKINPAIVVSSPIEGKVVTSKAVVGAMVDQSKEMLTIVDPRVLWVDAEIYEKDVAKVKIGQNVEVAVPAFPPERFRGKISYIGDVVNEETRTITVRTEVNNPDDRLKPGMFADVSIQHGEGRQVLAVPLAAILEDGNEQIVFVREKDGFARRAIETGAVNGTHRQVLKGLQAGEEVVVEGNHQLKSKLNEATLRRAHVH